MRDAQDPEHAPGTGGDTGAFGADPARTPRLPDPADAVDVDPEDDPGDPVEPADAELTTVVAARDTTGHDHDDLAADRAADLDDLGLDDLDGTGDDDPAAIFGGGPARAGDATAGFRRLAARIADAVLALTPESAPGGTRAARTAHLADLTPEGAAHADGVLADALAALDAVDDTVLDVADVVDLEILRVWVAGRQWELMDAPAGHDALLHVPARVLPAAGDVHDLPAGSPLDTGALDTVVGVLRCAHGRLEDLPERLAHARRTLTGLSAPVVDAALDRTRRLHDALPGQLEALVAPLEDADAYAPGLTAALRTAVDALDEHARWLRAVRPSADADPRIGAQRYGARLWYGLDAELTPEALLVRAESDLLGVEEELAELAGLLGAPPGPDGVRDLLRSVSADGGPPPAVVLDEVAGELRALGLVTVPDRLEAPARCPFDGHDESGTPDTPALEAVGGALRQVVAAHCGVPGHQLQAAHAAQAVLPTATRLVAPSPLFVEGWAVVAESLLTLSDAGTPAQRARRRVAQLALQLRRAVRCVVDVRCHVHGLSDEDAAAMLVDRAHLAPAAAAAVVAATLVHPVRGSVGYVGDHLVSDVVARLSAARPDAAPRAVHDAVLAHGPVPPRHLAVLLGLPAESAGRR
ncbi:DUF885 family protein [Kineosporia sp. R_H_3]|uniref:DUF885 family protein n=1 Tax=Kineosporia sp. R_H_3 TaxID=1961848 RepID=UPI000B4B5A61|nr:DUF885 family protein [Kineosporia sp. R_H_3]